MEDNVVDEGVCDYFKIRARCIGLIIGIGSVATRNSLRILRYRCRETSYCSSIKGIPVHLESKIVESRSPCCVKSTIFGRIGDFDRSIFSMKLRLDVGNV